MPVRYIIQSRVENADAFRDLGRRMTAFVRDNEPGTTTYNWYVSDDGTALNEDGFDDTAALQTHLANAGEQGFLDEFMSLCEIQSVRVLGEVDDAAKETLAAFGAVHHDTVQTL